MMDIYKILDTLKNLNEAVSPAQQAAIAIAKQKKTESDEGDYIDDPDPTHHAVVRGTAANDPTDSQARYPDEVLRAIKANPQYRNDIIADYKRRHGIMEGSVKDLLYTDSQKMSREEFVAHYVKEYQWDANRLGELYDEFNKMDEGMTKEAMWRDAERMTREQFCDKWGDEHGEFWDNIMGDIDEGSMADAEKHHTGPEFTGYWKGTDARTPGQHMVGGSAEESIEEQIAAEWNTYLAEFGGNNPTTGAQDPVQQKAMLQKTQHASQAFQKLQNMAGIKTGVGASQAAKTAVANTQNPNLNPSTGQGLDSTGKKVIGALGKGIEDALVNAQPADANKLIQNIQQIKQKSAGTM